MVEVIDDYYKGTDIQGRGKVFTTGQTRINLKNYAIKCVGAR